MTRNDILEDLNSGVDLLIEGAHRKISMLQEEENRIRLAPQALAEDMAFEVLCALLEHMPKDSVLNVLTRRISEG